MRVGVIGVNFKSSELRLRELLTRAFHRCFQESETPLAAVLLSTCNRSELYFSTEDLAETHGEILAVLRREVEVPFEHVLYSYFGGECFAHLAAVVCGLDSAIVAETEIQRQVKHAYAEGCRRYALSSSLHFMFQKCLKIGKWARTTLFLPSGRGSLESLVFQVGKLILKELNGASLLFVGNSEINRKIIAYFKERRIKELTLCTRSPESAKHLGIQAVGIEKLAAWRDYDIVVCGTKQSDYLITAKGVKSKGKSQVIFDLSIPRAVEPLLGRHPEVHLFNIEELGQMVDRKRSISTGEIQKAEGRIREEVDKQLLIFHNKQWKAVACNLL